MNQWNVERARELVTKKMKKKKRGKVESIRNNLLSLLVKKMSVTAPLYVDDQNELDRQYSPSRWTQRGDVITAHCKLLAEGKYSGIEDWSGS